MIGREVFGYRVEELIGKGSFASVYKVKKENESGTYVRALKHIVIPEKTQYLKIWNAMGKDTEKTEQYFENVSGDDAGNSVDACVYREWSSKYCSML